MTTPLKPETLGPFLGLSNRRRAYDLESEDRANPGDYLARAENVNLTDQGRIVRRKGYATVNAGTDCHSLWNDTDAANAYFADGADLKRAQGDGTGVSVSTVFSGLSLGHLLSFTHDGLAPVFSDGVALRRILPTGVVPLVPPQLNMLPLVQAVAGGALHAGRYQVCFSYLDADDREGGASPVQQVLVQDGGSIQITGLPAAFPSGVTALVIYLSPINGDVMMRAAVLTTAAASYTFPVMPTLGARCTTRRMYPMPAGSIVRMSNGRLFSAVGSVLFYSEPFMPGLYRPESGYVLFPQPVSLVEATANGIYIAAGDVTYFARGDIAQAELRTVLHYGAVPRTGGRIPNTPDCWWLSTRGVVIGDDNGNVKNEQEDEVRIDPALVGAAMFREQDGMNQFVAGTFGTRPTQAVVGSWADAEIIHKESA